MKKSCCAFFAFLSLLSAISGLSAQDGNTVVGKTIIHTDGTRTESVSDPNTRQMEQKTYDGNNILILRRHYQLNERSLPVMGNIYDGAGNLVARTQSFFDAFGRLQEERLSNLQGEVFQQVVHEYDEKGTAKQPKVINYKVNSPSMRPAMLDFTQFQSPPPAAQPETSGRVKPPVDLNNRPQTTPAPASSTPPATPPPEEPKKGFFQRLFKKKE
jgi:hypothetical protein